MKSYYTPASIEKNDLKRLRHKLGITQAELASLVNVSKKTVERWESSDSEITGPITSLYHLLINNPALIQHFELPPRTEALRMKYYFRNQLCTIIDVDEQQRKIVKYDYQRELIYRAFGKVEKPDYEDYEAFLESRCIPRERDKMKLLLRELDIPFYDPMLIIEKTQGRMAEDEFWLEIERDR